MKLIKILMAGVLLSASMAFSATVFKRDVTIVVPFLPGGASDMVARKTAAVLTDRFPGTAFVIRNIPGASNLVAVSYVLNEKDLDHVFIISNDDLITGPMSQGRTSYNEFVVTNIIGHSPYMLAVSTRQDANNFQTIVKNKGNLMFGSVGAGSGPATWLSSLDVIEWNNVPYKGAPAIITDVMGGSLNYVILSSFNMYDYIRDGIVAPVMISNTTRLSKYPMVPTFKELGFRGHEDKIYFAMYARKTADRKVIEEINRAIVDAQKNDVYRDFEDKSLVITPWDLKQSNQFFQRTIKQKQQFYERQIQK